MELDWNELLTGEMLMFGLLGKAFYAYPEEAWLQSLVEGQVFAEAPFAAEQPDVAAALGLLQTWSDQNRGGTSDQAFDDLKADYTRLFIGPGKVLTPPWESVHSSEERLVFQEETLQVREWYRRFGLQAENLYQEPDDHIGLELEFMAFLAKSALSALENQNQATFENLLDAQRQFLSEHLYKWGPAWCGQVEAQAQTGFYRGMAMLTRGALEQAARILAVKVAKR